MSSMCFHSSTSFSGLCDGASAAPLQVSQPSLPPYPAMLEDDMMVALSAQLEYRQEARRRVHRRNGRVLQDKGATSDEEEDQDAEHGAGLLSPSANGSPGGTGSEGLLPLDKLLPSVRYWRERASLMGGRLSLEAHAARLRERAQVQAELRAWVEEVMEGQRRQQQQQHSEGGDAGQQGRNSRSSNCLNRWSDMPAELYCELTGQQLQQSSQEQQQQLRQGSGAHHHHHHRRHHHRPRASSATEQQQAALPGDAQQQQQQQVPAGDGQTASSAAGGGLFLTPRTAEMFSSDLRNQVHNKIEREVQKRIAQWEHSYLADQLLLQQLQQEHQQQQLQQQLTEAHQQIAALTGHSLDPKAATCTAAGQQVTVAQHAAASVHVSNNGSKNVCHTSSCSSMLQQQGKQQLQKQQEVLLNPAPDVQVLQIIRTDSDQADAGILSAADANAAIEPAAQPANSPTKAALAAQHRRKSTGSLQPSTGSPRRSTVGGVTGADATAAAPASKGNNPSPRRGTASNSIGSTAGGSGTSTTSRNKTAPGAGRQSSPRRPGASGAAAAATSNHDLLQQEGLSCEQQEALIERLKHAEGVMELLQSDLQASLVHQQQLAQQLEQSNTQLQEAQLQLQQLNLGQEHGTAVLPGSKRSSADSASKLSQGEQLDQIIQLQQQVRSLLDELSTAKVQQAQAQQAVAAAQEQLKQQQKQQMELEEQRLLLRSKEEGLQLQLQQLHQQLQETSAALDKAPAAEVSAAIIDVGTASVTHINSGSSDDQQPAEHYCEQCKHLEEEVQQLRQQLQQQHTVGACETVELGVAATCQPTSPGSALAPNKQVKQEVHSCHQQQLYCKTWDGPHTPLLAALQATAAAAAAVGSGSSCHLEPHTVRTSCGSAVRCGNSSSSIWQLQAPGHCHDASSGFDSVDSCASNTKPPEAVMLAGVHRMRPLMHRPAAAAPVDGLGGIVGMAVGGEGVQHAGWQSARANSSKGEVSPGAERLLIEGLLTGRLPVQDRMILQLLGDVHGSSGGSSSNTALQALVAASDYGSAEYEGLLPPAVMGPSAGPRVASGLTMRRHSSSPRHRSPRTARPATAAGQLSHGHAALGSSLAATSSSGSLGGLLMMSPTRPQTARCFTGANAQRLAPAVVSGIESDSYCGAAAGVGLGSQVQTLLGGKQSATTAPTTAVAADSSAVLQCGVAGAGDAPISSTAGNRVGADKQAGAHGATASKSVPRLNLTNVTPFGGSM